MLFYWISDGSFEVMAGGEHLQLFDLPLQHGSTHMLKLMRRGTTREKTEALLI